MDGRDLRTLESWRRTLDHALQESDGKRNLATELQGIYLEGLLEAITRTIARIERDAQAGLSRSCHSTARFARTRSAKSLSSSVS